MFIERNVFCLKFGKSGQALALWKTFLQEVKTGTPDLHIRLLTDLTGRSYSIILEIGYETFAELEPSKCRLTQLPQWKGFYQQFIPFCESSERTLYKTEMNF